MSGVQLAAAGEEVLSAWFGYDVRRDGVNVFASFTPGDRGWAQPARLASIPSTSDEHPWSTISLKAAAGRGAAAWSRVFEREDGGYGGELYVARYLSDAGWLSAEEVNPSPELFVYDPQVGITSDGDVFVVWAQPRAAGDFAVQLKARQRKPEGWGPEQMVSDPSITTFFYPSPRLSVAGTTVVVFWGQESSLFAARPTAAGWERQSIGSAGPSDYFYFVDGVVDATGRAMASWATSTGGPRVSINFDGDWQPATALRPVPSGTPKTSMAMDGSGHGAVLWYDQSDGPVMRLSQVDGTGWRPPVELHRGQTNLIPGTVAMNHSGTGLASWSGADGLTPKYYVARLDGWPTSVEVDALESPSSSSLSETVTAVTPQGIRWLAFLDPNKAGWTVAMVSHCP